MPDRSPGSAILVQLEQANVGPHPFFVAAAGPVHCSERRQASRRTSRQPIGLVARVEKRIEGFLREADATAVSVM